MKQLRAHYGCPVELALEFVGGKWKTVILAHLKESPLRYRDLRQRLPTVSDKVLTERLKDLEQLGLVTKKQHSEIKSASVYMLTERGESLRPYWMHFARGEPKWWVNYRLRSIIESCAL